MSEKNNNQKRNDNDVSQYYPSDETYNDNDDVFYSYEKNKPAKSKFKLSSLTSSQWVLLALIFVVYTAVIFTAAWLIFYRPAQPSQLPFETDAVETGGVSTAPPLDNKDPNTDETGAGDHSGDNPTDDPGYVPKDGNYNILLIGRDKEANLADVTMIVNLDTANKKISVMQIPRDTLVNINIPTNKANAVYATYVASASKAGSKNPHLTAMEQYRTLLEKNLCLEIHHSMVVNLDAFVTIVDLFGGVDLYIPEAMQYEDPAQDLYIDIPAGMQHLDGYNSMCFVRFRSGFVQADLGRVNAQKIFMAAFFQKVKNSMSLSNLGLITDIANTIFRNVVTDMSVSDIIFYGKALLNTDIGSLNMMTLPGNMGNDAAMKCDFYVVNRAAALEIINGYFNIYKKDISDSIFDKNRMFCDTNDANILAVYYGDPESVLDGIYNGEDVNNESIYIPRVPTDGQ